MEKDNLTVDQIKETINRIKLEILEREDKIEELMQILNEEEDNYYEDLDL